MCINYIPTTKAVLVEYFGVDDPGYDWKEEVWQDYQAPIMIQRDSRRQAVIASYGMVSKRKVQPGNKHYTTMNRATPLVSPSSLSTPTRTRCCGECTSHGTRNEAWSLCRRRTMTLGWGVGILSWREPSWYSRPLSDY